MKSRRCRNEKKNHYFNERVYLLELRYLMIYVFYLGLKKQFLSETRRERFTWGKPFLIVFFFVIRTSNKSISIS